MRREPFMVVPIGNLLELRIRVKWLAIREVGDVGQANARWFSNSQEL